jgi:hypothetical protein
MYCRVIGFLCFWVLIVGAATPATADLRFSIRHAGDTPYLLVTGEFEYGDSLTVFSDLVRLHRPQFVTFNSPGGSITKAIELGRLIRESDLATLQIRELACVSACAYAFFGGTERDAVPGSIGMHQMSIGQDAPAGRDESVRSLQQMLALLILYMRGMGVDPSLLELILSVDPDDIRYLSGAEMIRYSVVTTGKVAMQRQPPAHGAEEESLRQPIDSFEIPVARSGKIRHPKGSAPFKASSDEYAADIDLLPNGTSVAIVSDKDRWYRVMVNSRVGFVHHTWVFVDQFQQGSFEGRYIQIKSFSSFERARDFIESSQLPLAAILASNGWFAVTLDRTFPFPEASLHLKRLKDERRIPDDAYVTYGNTYVRKVCCD